jgi:predicted Zn-dependent protease
MTNIESMLVHLHPDFQQSLEELFELWNNAQNSWNFIGLRPRLEAERILLTPGSISDDEASLLADNMRTAAGHSSKINIIIFTEKRLFDDDYFQLFVGGRDADEVPPRIGLLSLDFLRKDYLQHSGKPVLFRAIISNILFSIGIDCGLEDHDTEIRGCIMDFCSNMPDIEVGLRDGPRFCQSCKDSLKNSGHNDLVRLSDLFLQKQDLSSVDQNISESIVLRGERYKDKSKRFDYDVAISFAGEDRYYADKLARALRSAGLDVFYDRFDQAGLWGKNLHTYLTELYRLRAKYCVVLLSQNYKSSKWTRVELDAALSRELEEGEGKEYVLPIRIDNTEVTGILPSRGYLNWSDFSVEDIVNMIKKKINA